MRTCVCISLLGKNYLNIAAVVSVFVQILYVDDVCVCNYWRANS